MVYNDTSTKAGIIQKTESLCKLGDGGITGNTTLFYKITAYINEANKKVASALMQVDKRWTFDDYNYTDFPRGAATLIANQQDYTLPAATASGNASTLLGLRKVAVLDTNSTPQERILTLTDMDESDLNNIYINAGLPVVYKLVSNSIKMWPKPTSTYCTMASGLIVYFKRTPKPFDTTTTDSMEPGFMSTYHDLLAYDAAATYILPSDQKLAATYLGIFQNRLELLQEDYAHLLDDERDNPTRIIMKRRSSR